MHFVSYYFLEWLDRLVGCEGVFGMGKEPCGRARNLQSSKNLGLLPRAENSMCRACRMVMSEGTMHRHAYLGHLIRERRFEGRRFGSLGPVHLFFASKRPFLFVFSFSHYSSVRLSTARVFAYGKRRSGDENEISWRTFSFPNLSLPVLYPASVSPHLFPRSVIRRHENRTNTKKKK